MKKVLFLLMMVMMLGVVSGCNNIDNNSSQGKLDLSKIKVGDKINGMTVTLIAPFSEHNMSPPVLDFPIGEDNVTIEFSGETTLEGSYEYNSKDVGFIGGDVCFFPKTENIFIRWFCFNNQDLAREEFSPEGSKGTATIVIDDYNLNSYPSEVWSTARLLRVLGKK